MCHKFYPVRVIVERLTKSAHFLPVRANFMAQDYAGLYIRDIVRLHSVPLSIIISNRGAQFNHQLCNVLPERVGDTF